MKRGFTLIELVLVISIVSILLSFSLYSFRNSDTYMAKQEILSLKKDIEFTRNLAMINRKDSFLNIDEGQYTISCGDYRDRKDIRYIEFIRGKSNISEVSFMKKGSTKYGGSGTLAFQIGGKFYFITIEPVTGRVNLKNES